MVGFDGLSTQSIFKFFHPWILSENHSQIRFQPFYARFFERYDWRCGGPSRGRRGPGRGVFEALMSSNSV